MQQLITDQAPNHQIADSQVRKETLFDRVVYTLKNIQILFGKGQVSKLPDMK